MYRGYSTNGSDPDPLGTVWQVQQNTLGAYLGPAGGGGSEFLILPNTVPSGTRCVLIVAWQDGVTAVPVAPSMNYANAVPLPYFDAQTSSDWVVPGAFKMSFVVWFTVTDGSATAGVQFLDDGTIPATVDIQCVALV